MRDVVNRLVRRLRSQRGQALIMFVGIFTIIAVAGAISVDFGLWFSERRGAQKDADVSALAGARELLDFEAPTPSDEAAAIAVAGTWVEINDQQDNASLAQPVQVGTSCFADDPDDDPNRLDSVTVDVNHESRSLFASIFGLGEPDIGAHAMACAGSVITIEGGGVPIQVDTGGPCFDTGLPKYDELCPLEYGSQDDNPRGIIDLDADDDYCSQAGGSGDITELIEWGATGTCSTHPDGADGVCDPENNGPWYDCVATQAGTPKKVLTGFLNRLSREGYCDTDSDGIDSFDEATDGPISGSGPNALYEPALCDNDEVSPRIITIIVLGENPPENSGNTGYPIVAFAGFYVAGCKASKDPIETPPSMDDLTEEEKKCDVGGKGNPPGHVVVFGQFVNLTVPGEVGAFDPTSTLMGVSLGE